MNRLPTSKLLTRLCPPVFAVLFVSVSSIYMFMPVEGKIGTLLSWGLLPGVALYAVLNGSALFGAGFGKIGNFAIIAAGSAAAWTLLFCGLFALVARLNAGRQQ